MSAARSASLDGCRLHYTDTGGDVPLIALHGGMGIDGATLRVPAILGLADHRIRVIVPDQRGHGESLPRDGKPLTHEQWADDIRRLADALGLERFALLGHSYGGFLALEFATRWPGRLTRLVLVGTSAGPRAVQSSLLSDDDAVREHFRSRWPLFFTGPNQHWDLFESLRFSASAYNAAFVEELPKYDLRDRIGSVAAPTLLITGEKDWYVPDMEWLASHLPNATCLLVANAGHFVFLEQPKTFARLVSEFLLE